MIEWVFVSGAICIDIVCEEENFYLINSLNNFVEFTAVWAHNVLSKELNLEIAFALLSVIV